MTNEERKKKYEYKQHKLADVRNILLNYIRDHFLSYDLFAMMDGNEYSCIGDIDISVLNEVFSQNNYDKWDGLSFNRIQYYDYWALSIKNYAYSIYHSMNAEEYINCVKKNITSILDDYAKNKPNEFIEVYSAFGGLSFYKMNLFIDCNYNHNIDLSVYPIDDLCKQVENTDILLLQNIYFNVCEHNHFHLESIKKHNSKIRIYAKSLFKKVPDDVAFGLRGPA